MRVGAKQCGNRQGCPRYIAVCGTDRFRGIQFYRQAHRASHHSSGRAVHVKAIRPRKFPDTIDVWEECVEIESELDEQILQKTKGTKIE